MGKNNRLIPAAILICYLLLALGYGAINPLFEAPDENHHFFTVQYIADTGKLPVVVGDGDLLRQEAAQPPLYYILAAILMAPIDTSTAATDIWFNQFVELGYQAPLNSNAFVHTAAEAWPWQGFALAAHLVRIFSALLGVGTLLCIGASGRLLWPQHPARAWLAMALVAFLPQFAFLHGSITNDVLIIFLSSAVLWQLVRLWQTAVTRRRLLLLGITIGLATLTKMTGVILLLLAGFVLLLLAWRDRRPRLLLDGLLFTLLSAIFVAGWLLWRNWVLYGDVTAVNQFIALAGGDRHYNLQQVWGERWRVLRSTVAVFGWTKVHPPNWVYALWVSIVALATGGVLLGLVRFAHEGWPPLAERRKFLTRLLLGGWLGLWFIMVFAAWLNFMLQTSADQGRLLFPALLPVALGLAWGISQWRQRWLTIVVTFAALLTSLYSLLVVIPAAYALPDMIDVADIPAEAISLPTDMGQGIKLLAIQAETKVAQPGDWVPLTLYWQKNAPMDNPLSEVLVLYGRNNERLGAQQNYHGGGLLPLNLWPEDKVIVEPAMVRVWPDLASEAGLPVAARLLLQVGEKGEPVEITRIKVLPSQSPVLETDILAQIGAGIELVQAEATPLTAKAGTAVTVDVRWQVSQPPGRELTTFVHLGDPSQAPLAQGDGPAVDGNYSTGYWGGGELISDSYTVWLPADLPPGRYPLQMGMYDLESGARLPLYVDGQQQAFDAFPLGNVIISD